jgi:hypothetical protein
VSSQKLLNSARQQSEFYSPCFSRRLKSGRSGVCPDWKAAVIGHQQSSPKAFVPFAPLQTIEPQFPALQRSAGAILDTTLEAVTEFISP